MVNAQGELLHADESVNCDYLWAARGAGAGFFGVVTRFELKTFALPPVIRFSSYAYELEHLETVLRWAMELTPRIPENLEFIIGCYGHDGTGKRATPRLFVNATAFGRLRAAGPRNAPTARDLSLHHARGSAAGSCRREHGRAPRNDQPRRP